MFDFTVPPRKVLFRSKSLLKEAIITLERFPPSELPDGVKPKRFEQIHATFQPLYRSILEFKIFIQQELMNATQLLANNEVAVESLISDYKHIFDKVAELVTKTRQLKQYPELKDYTSKIDLLLKPKFWLDLFVSDIKDIQTHLNIEVDIKDAIQKVKQ